MKKSLMFTLLTACVFTIGNFQILRSSNSEDSSFEGEEIEMQDLNLEKGPADKVLPDVEEDFVFVDKPTEKEMEMAVDDQEKKVEVKSWLGYLTPKVKKFIYSWIPGRVDWVTLNNTLKKTSGKSADDWLEYIKKEGTKEAFKYVEKKTGYTVEKLQEIAIGYLKSLIIATAKQGANIVSKQTIGISVF